MCTTVAKANFGRFIDVLRAGGGAAADNVINSIMNLITAYGGDVHEGIEPWHSFYVWID